MKRDRQDDGHHGAAHELAQQPAAQHLPHLVHDLANARPRAERHEDQHALAVAARMTGEEHTEADDDDGVDADRVGAAHGILDVAEQPAGIGDQVRKVLPASRTEKIDPESLQVALEDAELCVHHLHQHLRLRGEADDAPADRKGCE